jgi:coproporphyrinogen III oxidase
VLDADLARRVLATAMTTYAYMVQVGTNSCSIAFIFLSQSSLVSHPDASITPEARATQLDYHTLYAFQVLTLDRGTTHGLLAHDQNDVGTLGSIPNFLNKRLLESWVPRMPQPQNLLLKGIVAALPEPERGEQGSFVSIDTRQALAGVLRKHYTTHPKARHMQAKM